MKKSANIFILFIIIGVIFSCLLSFWQFKRYNYKNSKNENLAKAFQYPEASLINNEKDESVYQVKGYFDYDKQILLGPRNLGQKIGKYIYSVFYVNGEYPILVNRGFVEKNNYQEIEDYGKSSWQVIKIFSQNETAGSLFGIDNIAEKNIWIRIKMQQISEFLNVNLGSYYYRKIASDPSPNNLIIEDFNGDYRYSNVHFQYIFFWFFIALTQFIMLIIYIKKKSS